MKNNLIYIADDGNIYNFDGKYRQRLSELAQAVGSADWLSMVTAPKDGSEILLLIHHCNRQYASEQDKHEWESVVKAKWIDHNGGGWTWNGMVGKPVQWKCLPNVKADPESGQARG